MLRERIHAVPYTKRSATPSAAVVAQYSVHLISPGKIMEKAHPRHVMVRVEFFVFSRRCDYQINTPYYSIALLFQVSPMSRLSIT